VALPTLPQPGRYVSTVLFPLRAVNVPPSSEGGTRFSCPAVGPGFIAFPSEDRLQFREIS